MNKKYYVGVGNRSTPYPMAVEMRATAFILADAGYVLLSGGAKGADTAFELGCDDAKGDKLIFYTDYWSGRFNKRNWTRQRYKTGNWQVAERIAEEFHPAWYALSPFAKKLMTRNSFVMFGGNLKVKPDFVICWTPDGVTKTTSAKTGGTGQSIRIAKSKKIKVYNMKSNPDVGHYLGLY